MSLNRIKRANKRAKLEQRRKIKRKQVKKQTLKIRSMMKQQRQAMAQPSEKRRKELNYIEQLTQEIIDG